MQTARIRRRVRGAQRRAGWEHVMRRSARPFSPPPLSDREPRPGARRAPPNLPDDAAEESGGARRRPSSARCPAGDFSRAATAVPLVPLFSSSPTPSVPRLRCFPRASPFSSAWRRARRLPPGFCCALSASPPGAAAALPPAALRRETAPPHPSSASGAATGSSRIGGGEAGQGATRPALGGRRQRRLPRGSGGAGTAPCLPSRRGGASHLTTARA